MSLFIDLYANDGSPLGIQPPDIYGRGVGGAELAMMTWAEMMAERGHKVRVFNNPKQPGEYNKVEYLPQTAFSFRDNRDVFIAYRSPNRWTRIAHAAVKLFWSTDQYTVGNFATDVFPFVDRIVCISPFHVAYHKERYGAEDSKIGYFDLGVRVEEYNQAIEKVSGRCIFCSVPDRGLEILRMMWPKIKERVSNASLIITSDYTLWGAANPLNHEHRLNWLHQKDVEFVGNIPRQRLVQEQLRAVCQPYSGTYDELFCISAAECQVAGAYPITTGRGALSTTNQWGAILEGNVLDGAWQNGFIERVELALLGYPVNSDKMKSEARKRFDWNVICAQWEHLIETGEFVTNDSLVCV